MKQMAYVALLFCMGALFGACRSSEQSMEKDSTTAKVSLPDQGPGIPPGQCRLVATVTKIEEKVTGTGEDPCSKAPCIAEVRIDEILGYGSAFGGPLATGKSIRVKFTYTTAPTKTIFPDMSPALPGVKVGTRFQADVGSAGPSMDQSNGPKFAVGQYSVRQE